MQERMTTGAFAARTPGRDTDVYHIETRDVPEQKVLSTQRDIAFPYEAG